MLSILYHYKCFIASTVSWRLTEKCVWQKSFRGQYSWCKYSPKLYVEGILLSRKTVFRKDEITARDKNTFPEWGKCCYGFRHLYRIYKATICPMDLRRNIRIRCTISWVSHLYMVASTLGNANCFALGRGSPYFYAVPRSHLENIFWKGKKI